MQQEPDDGKKGGWSGRLWMAICCVPMAAFFVLIALGYWSAPWRWIIAGADWRSALSSWSMASPLRSYAQNQLNRRHPLPHGPENAGYSNCVRARELL
jgi:hypothetical protein